jgi:protein ImuB
LLERLAAWCVAYTPWAAVDGWSEGCAGGGLLLDITGCAHLFGETAGEAALLADLVDRLGKFGFAARAAAADTAGAAWAWARFGATGSLASGAQREKLAPLPVTALRLAPEMAAGLARLGLRRVGDLYPLPRAGLAARFGPAPGRRLDQALGAADEPLSPPRPPFVPRVHCAFAEPVARPEDVRAAAQTLLGSLTGLLERQELGVRRLELTAFRLDASLCRLAIGTSRPSRHPRHLFRLLAEPLAGLDAGFGIESLHLEAVETQPLAATQTAFGGNKAESGDDLARLLDGLGNRLGFHRLHRFAPRPSHWPERAVREVGLMDATPGQPWPAFRRPVCLLARPEAVEAVAPLPDAPPLLFRWRRQVHRVHRAEGPERLAATWWTGQATAADRDYYCVEDKAGRRYWLYREGFYGEERPIRWFVHGIFS